MNNTKWIADEKSRYSNHSERDNSLLLRKLFSVREGLLSAKLEVSGLGYGVYTVNGKRATEEELTTPFTAFDKRIIYNEYDITDKLQSGENVFGAYLGNGWYNDDATLWDFKQCTWKNNPRLCAKIILKYNDGTSEIIRTDSSWKACEGPCTFNHLRQGEIYDARLEKEGWDTVEFDDSDWKNAITVRSPGGILEPMNMPPIRVIRTLKPVAITEKGFYDFGENISGRARIKLKGEAGREVVLQYEERLDENGGFANVANNFTRLQNNPLHFENKYILKGGDVEEYAPEFTYYGFRYVSVKNAPENFEIVAEVIHTDLKGVGTFKCSDKMLNLIHEASVRSTLTNYHSIPTDCPHREQNGWTGDAALSCEQALMNFDMTAAYKKWMNDFKDCQRPSGAIPGIIPTSSWGFNWGNGPAWDVAMPAIPWFVYKNTGDSSLIEQMWENNARYFEYMCLMSDDYIPNYGLGDWCPPPSCEILPIEFTDTVYFYFISCVMADCAKIIGKDASHYSEVAKNVKAAWKKKFYAKPEFEKKQSYFAMSVYYDLIDDDEKQSYADRLAKLVEENGNHIDCGILGTKCIFTVLSEYGYADVLYKMVTVPTMPSYAYWINQGMTTFCEHWNMEASCNHHMYSEVDNWFYKYVAGIRVNEGDILIKPCFIKEVESVAASHRGVSVSYDMDKMIVETDKKVAVCLEGKTYTIESGKHEFKLNRR